MPTGVPPTRVAFGTASTSGSPSATGSGSRHSSARVERPPLSIPWISCSSSSSTRGLCLVPRWAVPAKSSPVSLTCVLLSVRPRAALSFPVQRTGPVHRRPPARVAADLVLRVVLAGPDRATGGLGVLGDLPLDRALHRRPVAAPGDVVALGEPLAHGAALPSGAIGHTSPDRGPASPFGVVAGRISSRSVDVDGGSNRVS